MTMYCHRFALTGLLLTALAAPAAWSAGSGCVNGELLGVYDAQLSNINTQTIIQSLATATSTTATTPSKATGFAGSDNSLSGNVPAMGRYYLDGNGNIIGVSTGKVQFNLAVGKYTVNTDCTGRITLA